MKMRLWTLALVFVAAVSVQELKALADEAGAPFPKVTLEITDKTQLWAASHGPTNSVKELKALADKAGAPFTTVALERMDNIQLWGAKRAERSADVVIINKSGISFKLLRGECFYGSSSSGLLAESYLDAQTSTVLGYQSDDDDRYAYIHCFLIYGEGRDEDQEEAFKISLHPTNSSGDVTGTGDSFSDDIEIMKVDYSIDTDSKNYQLVFEVQPSNDMEKRWAPVR